MSEQEKDRKFWEWVVSIYNRVYEQKGREEANAFLAKFNR